MIANLVFRKWPPKILTMRDLQRSLDRRYRIILYRDHVEPVDTVTHEELAKES